MPSVENPVGFAAPGFSATAPAEEVMLGTPNASLHDTQEFSEIADTDDMNGVHEAPAKPVQMDAKSLETPTFMRQEALATTVASKTVQDDPGSIKKASGVDYDVPAFLRGNALSDIF